MISNEIFTSLFVFFQKYVGEISLAKDRQSAVNDIANGQPILYRVRFPIQNPVPKLTAILYNDQLICTGPKGCAMIIIIMLDSKLIFCFYDCRSWTVCNDYNS